MLVSFYRIIKFAFQDFWRNIWLSIITVSIITLTLFSISFLVVLNIITDTAIKTVKDKIDVSIYFKPEVKDTEIGETRSKIAFLPEVKDTKYISPTEALEQFKIKHKNDSVILESLEELGKNPLGATLIVKAKTTKDYPKILAALDDPQYDDLIQEKNFDDHKEIINKISTITDKTRQAGIAVSSIFALIAILVVFNTIRVAIYTHREELGIMKLVGATNWFVRAPYLAEGILFSLLAVMVTVIIFYPFLNLLQPYLAGFFEASSFNIINYFNQHFITIFGLEFLLAVVINTVTTTIAAGKYLKV